MLEVSTIVTMVVVLGYIWGGTAYLLSRAFRREQEKE